MLQAPTDTLITPRAAITTAVGIVLGWLLRSLLMSGFKNAVINAVKTELEERFKAFEEHVNNKIDQKIDTIREEAQIERRNLPPRGHR